MDDEEEEEANGGDMDEVSGEVIEDEEAETVLLNGVAAARGRRLKSQKAGQNEDARGTPGNAASSQPYEAMPVI